MAKFSNVKVGDKIFLIGEGWCKVRLRYRSCFYLENEKGLPLQPAFDLDGRISGERTVVCYWKEVILPTEEEDKKPFDLVDFLRDNLEPKEFEYKKENFYLYYSPYGKRWYSHITTYDDVLAVYFKRCTRELVDELDENKITPQQLKQAYKELGWL